jgi:hypothetical protein
MHIPAPVKGMFVVDFPGTIYLTKTSNYGYETAPP